MDLIFEEPPAPTGGGVVRSEFRAWLDTLRGHPGRWAKHPDLHPKATGGTKASQARSGTGYGTSAGEFEIVTRVADKNSIHIFARYVGGDTTPTEAPA